MKPSQLKKRCEVKQIEDWDWYLEAYMRCCHRIEDEQRRSGGKNLERLQRHLQALYEKCIQGLEEDRARARKERAAAIAINHAITDHHLPRSMLRKYEGERG